MTKVWLITGSSRGLGRAITIAALNRGDRVAATARAPDALGDLVNAYPGQVLALRLDVTNRDEAERAVTATTVRFG
jgi:NAD(P)-dependent dehydrogenase (short-subunit alcohol dehydrogenase family)